MALKITLFFSICSLLKHCESERMILEISEIKKIANYINCNKKRFSKYDFTNSKSIYSKKLYRLYTEYQDKSTYAFSIEAFREFLDINSRYPH
ncbi:MAG TPA: RepB family plasmid replication initiator protein [Staphylococcus sp.]|nr:hypothetical protein CD135_09425 [Mammaliicoccus lentus]HBV04406.1 RepB family plasmid replication initiator protein [Staphylococcus sp.]